MDTQLLDILWIIVAAALVFVMQGGFALLESGLTRSKNSINVAIKNLTDLGVSLMAFYLVGFGLMFGITQSGLFGTSKFALDFSNAMDGAFFLFQAMFCSTAATIVSGAVAERMKYSSYILSTLLLSALIYPVIGHWAWASLSGSGGQGWLETMGFVDFAGSTVVHSLGGWIALAALVVIGPRKGRFQEGKSNKINASNVPAAVLGVILLWFGWFGFNGGSTLALNADVPGILIRTTMAAAAGMVITLAVGWPLVGLPDVSLVINGALAGLVAITAPVHAVTTLESLIIGAVGGIVMLLGSWILEKLQVDDAVGAIPVHLVAGVWGTLAVAIFGDPEILGTGLVWYEQLGVQALGVVSIGGFAFWGSLIFLTIFNRIKPLRVSEEDELKGLNVAEHGASTELMDLTNVMEDQAITGDLSKRAPEEPFTEVGQIAKEYNRVIGKLEENLVAKSEYLGILDNVTDGLFLLDVMGNIGPYYSKALEQIIGFEKLAGEPLDKILFPLVQTDVMESIKDFLALLFNPALEFETVQRLNPLGRVEIFIDTGEGEIVSKFVRFQFKRVMDLGKVVRLMVIVQDISKEVELESRMRQTRKETEGEMALFYRFIHLDPVLLKEFVQGLETKLEKMSSILQSGQNAPREVLRQLMKLAHSIKGEAAFFELDLITELAHQLEEVAGSLLKKENLENKDFIGLTLKLGDLHKTSARMTGLMSKLVNFQDHFVAKNIEMEKGLTKGMAEFSKKLAKEHSKLVEMEINAHELPYLSPEKIQKIRDIIIQLTRNSVVHGIESSTERLERGKKESGLIKILTETREDGLMIDYMDDGRGFPVQKLKLKALEQGIDPNVVDGWKKADFINFTFSEGMSTADKVGKSAGRGVGMGLVRDLAREMKGKLMVNFKPGEFTRFRIFVPSDKRN